MDITCVRDGLGFFCLLPMAFPSRESAGRSCSAVFQLCVRKPSHPPVVKVLTVVIAPRSSVETSSSANCVGPAATMASSLAVRSSSCCCCAAVNRPMSGIAVVTKCWSVRASSKVASGVDGVNFGGSSVADEVVDQPRRRVRLEGEFPEVDDVDLVLCGVVAGPGRVGEEHAGDARPGEVDVVARLVLGRRSVARTRRGRASGTRRR